MHIQNQSCKRSIVIFRLLTSISVIIFSTMSIQAEIFTVTTHTDSGAGSLRHAIIDANGNGEDDTILFDSNLNGQTITLTDGEILISSNVSINGPGADQLTILGNNISSNTSRVFNITMGTIEMMGVTIRNREEKTRFDNTEEGGGIRIASDAILTLIECAVNGNTAIINGGGIFNEGTLTLVNSSISNNQATFGSGGGIYNVGHLEMIESVVSENRVFDDFGGGGGIYNSSNSTLILTKSTIHSNTANSGGGGGIYNHKNSSLTSTHSTINGNHANFGGGIANTGTTEFTNSTVSGNMAISGGGIFNMGDFNLTSCTVSDNQADFTGGIYNDVDAEMILSHTIVGNNEDIEELSPDIFGTVNANYCLIESILESSINGENNTPNQDPNLGPLQDNGGPTLTHALLTDSPAIDAGNPNFESTSNEDQRGRPRIQDAFNDSIHNPIVDIGAYEFPHPNESPKFIGLDNHPTFVEDSVPVVLDDNATIHDVDLDILNKGSGSYAGSIMALERSGGASEEDVFSSVGTLESLNEDGSLVVDGVHIGTVTTNSGGVLELLFNENASTVLVHSVLQQIAYSNTSDNPSTIVTVEFTFYDGNMGEQGTGDALLSEPASILITIEPTNDPPIVQNQSVIIFVNSSADIQLLAIDPENDPFTFSIPILPTNGVLSDLDAVTGRLTYTPNPNFEGNDSFTFRVHAGITIVDGIVEVQVIQDPDATNTPTPTVTPSESPTPTISATFTSTPTTIATQPITPTMTFTETPTITNTPTTILTATFSATLQATVTDTPRINATETKIPVPESTETSTPTLTSTPTAIPTVIQESILDEIILAQGEGGTNLVNIRTFENTNGLNKNEIIDQYRAFNKRAISFLGGGSGRSTYVTIGDIDNDGNLDYVNTFGAINNPAVFPNIVFPVHADTKQVIGHPFSAFPTGTGNDVRYNEGELRTAIGDFKVDGENLLAVAQGSGSNKSIVRLFQYTGMSAPNAWKIVGQFQPLDDVPTRNNMNGGVTLSSADIDGDGRDELIVGQTNSPTSLSQFSILDIDSTGNKPSRTNYVAFPNGFRGQGGVELIAADLNGDGMLEIVSASKGNLGTNDLGSILSVIRLFFFNQNEILFLRPNNSILKVVGNDDVNPGGGLYISAGEYDGDRNNGEEILIGSGEEAPQSFYRIVKLLYDPNDGEVGTVTGFNFLIGPPRNVNFIQEAFVGEFNPPSGAVHVVSGNVR